MRKRYLTSGLEGFTAGETLELLLFPFVPRVDTVPMAEAMLQRFGSLRGVFSAGYDEIRGIKGMTDRAARAVLLYGDMLRQYDALGIDSRIWVGNASLADAFVRRIRDSLPNCDYVYLLLDERNYYIDRVVFAKDVDAQQIESIFCHILDSNINNVLLVRLSPTQPMSNEKDIEMAERFVKVFDMLSVFLIDVLVVGATEYYSYRASDKTYPIFDNIAQRMREVNKISQCTEEYDPYS